MEVVVVGATGYVGSTVLRRCLLDASISRIHVLTRRPLSDDVMAGDEARRKLCVVTKTEWMAWEEGEMEGLRRARACL
ncbi:hypothetical protein E4U42_000418, partial [Claviceps africana]